MSYQALYRKWRPTVFEDVVGQSHIVETLRNQINAGKIAHAYLFCGSRGTGKTSTAKIFSRAVNCEDPQNGNPCNICRTCQGVLNNSIFDVVEIDGASNNKVDDVRSLRDELVYPPTDVKYKVYIIDEVHMLTTEAFNALLKTLEEPPSYVIFILATTEFHKIPATILSRCQKFDFKRITYQDTAARLLAVAKQDGIEVTPAAINLIAKAADGSLRDGLSKLDQCLALGLSKIDYKDAAMLIGASDPEFLSKFCNFIIKEDLGQAFLLLNEGVGKGVDALRLFTDVIDYFRDLLMLKTSGDLSLIVNTEEEVVKTYEAQLANLPLPRILRIIEVLFEGLSHAKYTASPKLAFETALLKIASKKTQPDIEVLLDRLDLLEDKLKRIEEQGVVVAPMPQQMPAFSQASVIEEAEEEDKEEFIEEEPESFEASAKEEMLEDNQDDFEFTEEEEEHRPSFLEEPIKVEEETLPVEEEGPDFLSVEEPIEKEETIEEIPNFISEEEPIKMEQEASSNTEEKEELIFSPFEEDPGAWPDPPEISTEDPSYFSEEGFFPASKEEEPPVKEEEEPEAIQDNEALKERAEMLILNFKDVLHKVTGADIGFDNIIRKAQPVYENGSLILRFSGKVLYDIAKNNRYDQLIRQAVKDYTGEVFPVSLAFTEENREDTIKKDLLEDVLEIAEQNQMIFHIE